MTLGDFASADLELIGKTIAGKFVLRACVGVGASGAVYQADQTSLGRTVAVKILRDELAADQRSVRRFGDEALAASRLNHPNTVSVIDYGQTPAGLLYLVMEFVRGRTLTEVVEDDQEDLTPSRAADITMQVLSGLEEAHNSGVVHADLKSDNIIVERRRDDWELVKVVDFGIARLLGAQGDSEEERTICGTPEYMAPEVIRGVEPTFASDIYAVGVILYELLARATPFADRDNMEILAAHLHEAPLSPSALTGRDVHGPLSELALKALSKNPADRFATAMEFREAVSRAMEARDIPADIRSCSACGVESPVSFKFCPECGQPRAPLKQTAELEPTDAGVPKVRFRKRGTRRFRFATDPGKAIDMFPLPMRGRDEALAGVRAFLAGEREQHVLQIVGAAGAGRTRLLNEACSSVTDQTVYLAGIDPSGLAMPFHPVRSVIAAVLDLPPVCSRNRLRRALDDSGLGLTDMPGIAELFGHPTDLRQLERGVRRRELLAAAIRVLQAVAEQHKVTVVFEDADLYDHPSHEFLRRLAEEPGRDNLRVIVTNGPEFAARWPLGIERIDLEPLSDEALAELSADIREMSPAMPSPEDMRELCGSMPGHIDQLVRYVFEGGSLDSAPKGLADLIAARLDFLPRLTKHVLQALAVFGGEVARDTVRIALDGVASAQSIEEAIDTLATRGLVRDDHDITFGQRVLAEVAYGATPRNVRTELHSHAVQALEQITGAPAILGHHHALAGNLDKAAQMLTRAGDEHVDQLDDVGACGFYNRALSAAREALLAGDEPDSRNLFVEISIRLADALRVTGQLALARGILDEAEQHGRDVPTLRSQLLRSRAHVRLADGDAEGALAELGRAIGLSITTGQQDLISDLYIDQSTIHLRSGRRERAIAELEEGLNLVTLGEGAASKSGGRNLWRVLLRLAQLYDAEGQVDAAAEISSHALRHAERVRSRAGSARILATIANLHERTGNYHSAADYRGRAVEAMRALGDRRATAELLLAGTTPTRQVPRISPSSLREARKLAEEIGWSEGVRMARETGSVPAIEDGTEPDS